MPSVYACRGVASCEAWSVWACRVVALCVAWSVANRRNLSFARGDFATAHCGYAVPRALPRIFNLQSPIFNDDGDSETELHPCLPMLSVSADGTRSYHVWS